VVENKGTDIHRGDRENALTGPPTFGVMDCGGKRSATPLFSRQPECGFCFATLIFYESTQRLFLLPAGEGQDEGERDVIIFEKYFLRLPHPLRAKNSVPVFR